MSLNQFNFVGNLTRDGELKHVSDSTVVKIGVAINERYKDRDGGWKDGDPVFIDVELWGKAAERISEMLVKGAQVCGSGKLKIDSWDDKETGQKRSKPVVTAFQLHVIEKPPRDERDDDRGGRGESRGGGRGRGRDDDRDDRPRGRGRDDDRGGRGRGRDDDREEAPRGRGRGVSDDLGGSAGF